MKKIHAADVAAGRGSVYVPESIARKYPGADREWGWQYLFPGEHLSADPRARAAKS